MSVGPARSVVSLAEPHSFDRRPPIHLASLYDGAVLHAMTKASRTFGQFYHIPQGMTMTETGRRMISPFFVEEAIDCLKRQGKAPGKVLASVGLPARIDAPISAESYGALWLAIAAEMDDEFFGMAARPMRRGSFTLLCHCILHARTLDQALRRARDCRVDFPGLPARGAPSQWALMYGVRDRRRATVAPDAWSAALSLVVGATRTRDAGAPVRDAGGYPMSWRRAGVR